MAIKRLDHVGITVKDLEAAVAFFLALGMDDLGGGVVEGPWLDTTCGVDGGKVEMRMLGVPGGGTTIELSQFLDPVSTEEPQPAHTTQLGYRNVMFEVDDLRAEVARLEAAGFHLVRGIANYEDTYLLCYVHGPEGMIVALAESIC